MSSKDLIERTTVRSFLEELKKEFSGAITKVEDRAGHLCAEFSSDAAGSVFGFCAHDPSGRFDFLEDLTAYDDEKDIMLIYNLYSTILNHRIFFKTALQRGAPKITTVMGFWSAAKFYEREVTEMFGVRFKNNEQEGPFLLPQGWIGHPMRKDYAYPESFQGLSHRRERAQLDHSREE